MWWAPSISTASLQSSQAASIQHLRGCAGLGGRCCFGGSPNGRDQAKEVEFGDRLGAACYVAEDLDDQLAVAARLDSVGHQPEISGSCQSLLHSGGETAAGAAVGRHPSGSVNQGPRNPCTSRLPCRMHVGVSEHLRVVRDNIQPEWRRTPLVPVGDE